MYPGPHSIMSNQPQWYNVGRATASQNWTPSPTSVRPTIAQYTISQNKFSPTHLRQPFGEIPLQSTSEQVYKTANQHTSFLNRTTKLRNSMSASGLSFIRDIAETIPLPSSNKPNLITRRHKRPTRMDPLLVHSTAAADAAAVAATAKKTSFSLTIPTSPIIKTTNGKYGAGHTSTSKGYQTVGRPEHARRKVFIDAAFNASNFASTGVGMASGLGVLKAQSFYTDKNRPFNGPKIFFQKTPKFTEFSTKQTMRRGFLTPPVGRKAF